MTPAATASWRRLDQPGRDAARLEKDGSGWRLHGTAHYRADTGPARIQYEVELATDWSTRTGHVSGFIGTHTFDLTITRQGPDWLLNGVPQPAVQGLLDLDFQFTPATNLQQLRRLNLQIGQAAACPVAWLQEGATTLTVLPQTYRRIDAMSYAYEAPTVGYRARLTMAENGFAAEYPDGWKME